MRYFDVAAWLGARSSTANCGIERLEASDKLAQRFSDFKRGGRYLSTPARGLGVLPATSLMGAIISRIRRLNHGHTTTCKSDGAVDSNSFRPRKRKNAAALAAA